ncbi:bolA-like protein 1 [Dermacentor albipictus]|uniref:bolA-like protein 1 n=1 Tax=Dermacentor albipictus TaxID=60249 RepID=UPI0031FBF933
MIVVSKATSDVRLSQTLQGTVSSVLQQGICLVKLQQAATTHTLICKMASGLLVDTTGPTESKILNKLKEALNPQELLVENESYMHNVPKGSETHFRVTIVSSAFEGKSLVQKRPLGHIRKLAGVLGALCCCARELLSKQHAMVYAALKDELKNPVHALSVETSTPDKWQSKTGKSPPCLGGMKREG